MSSLEDAFKFTDEKGQQRHFPGKKKTAQQTNIIEFGKFRSDCAICLALDLSLGRVAEVSNSHRFVL